MDADTLELLDLASRARATILKTIYTAVVDLYIKHSIVNFTQDDDKDWYAAAH